MDKCGTNNVGKGDWRSTHKKRTNVSFTTHDTIEHTTIHSHRPKTSTLALVLRSNTEIAIPI